MMLGNNTLSIFSLQDGRVYCSLAVSTAQADSMLSQNFIDSLPVVSRPSVRPVSLATTSTNWAGTGGFGR
jgi:hypothetical protein